MPVNPSSAPSGPDVARQIAEQAYAEAISSLPIDARDEWSAIDVDTRNVWIRPAFVKAIARALADARREGEREDGIGLITAERDRQVVGEGWTPDHDDRHVVGEIACAAAVYALPPNRRRLTQRHHEVSENGGRDLAWSTPTHWPWPHDYKPSDDRVRELVKAGALIAAEIDRLLRQRAAQEAR